MSTAPSSKQMLRFSALASGIVKVKNACVKLFSRGDPNPDLAIWQAVFEKCADGIIVLAGTRIIACNEAAVQFAGYQTRAEVLVRSPAEMAPEFQSDGRRSSDVAREKIEMALREGQTRFEWIALRADGTSTPVQITLVPAVLAGEPVVLSYRRDISDLVAARQEKSRAIARLANEFERDVGSIVSMVSGAAKEVETTAQSLTLTADQTTRRVAEISGASEEASANVQSVASAVEQLTSSVGEISRQVAKSSSIAVNAVHASEQINVLVRGLAEAARKIGSVTSMISEIASQTNLLALNATIEAARAGDAGRGFAVVAAEVKGLSDQTARATDEIGSHIGAMQSATNETVVAIQAIGGTISQIKEIASAITASVDQQGAATREIARNISDAANGVQVVAGNISAVTQTIDKTSRAANDMLSAAGNLAKQADTLQQRVSGFLAAIRAQ